MTSDKLWCLAIAAICGSLAASFIYRGEAVSRVSFIARDERPGCFWSMTGVMGLIATAALIRAILIR
jgi:hypothetical protein